MTTGPVGRPRVLIAGVGNVFLGDDAFGVEVAQRLAQRPPPGPVVVADFGIRGLDLAYSLLDGYEAVILVDALPRGGPPGTLYVLEPDPGTTAPDAGADLQVDGHNLDPAKVLRLAAAMGGQVKRLLLVGCEPEPPAGPDDMRMGLSGPVRAALDEAVPLVESLVAQLLRPEREDNPTPGKEV
jgi:hydrogenase maturation protease